MTVSGPRDPLAAWHALPAEARATTLVTLRNHTGDSEVEVFAATRDGDDVVVYAIYESSNVIPQQVGADLISYSVRVVAAIGDKVTPVRHTVDQRDEREDYDSTPEVTALRERMLADLFGPQISDEEDGFLTAIEAAPEDDGPRLVYVDWLQQRGDPRGEFMARQRAGRPIAKLVTDHLRGLPWLDLDHTTFDRGFMDVFGLSKYTNHYTFVESVEVYARLRPLPSQFARPPGLFACISPDRRRFAYAYTLLITRAKRTTGVWTIKAGRCADHSTLFEMEMPWMHYRKKGTNLIQRIDFSRDGAAFVLTFQVGPPMRVELPRFR